MKLEPNSDYYVYTLSAGDQFGGYMHSKGSRDAVPPPGFVAHQVGYFSTDENGAIKPEVIAWA